MGAALARLETAPRGPRTGLWFALRAIGVSNKAFAAAIGVTERTATRWIVGAERPSEARQRAIAAWVAARGAGTAHLFVLQQESPVDNVVTFPGAADAPLQPGADPAAGTLPIQQEPPLQTTPLEFLDEDALAHFGLENDPFLGTDGPEDLFMHPGLKATERAVKAAIRNRHIIAIVGEPGAGKSSLIRRVWAQLRREERIRLISLASLNRQQVTPNSISVAILRDLIGKDTSAMQNEARSELLRRTLEDQDQQGCFPALFIDEAHLLPSEALIAIKQVWDSHVLYRQLAVVMVGQPKLHERLLNDTRLREVTGRTQIIQIPAMSRVTAEYLSWRFSRVGADAAAIFSADAIKALGARGEHALWINNLAVRAMRAAKRLGDKRVELVHVGQQ